MRAAIQMRGTVETRRRFLAVKRAGVAGIQDGLSDLTNQIAARAQQYAPVDSGALRASIAAAPPSADRSFVRAEVTAGDAATAAYAVRQHEDLSLNHPNGGGAKFLELAMADFSGATGNDIVGAKMRARVEAV